MNNNNRRVVYYPGNGTRFVFLSESENGLPVISWQSMAETTPEYAEAFAQAILDAVHIARKRQVVENENR